MKTYSKEFQQWAKETDTAVFGTLSEVVENPAQDFKVGQKCTFTNEYGVKFPGLTILGFCKQQNNIFTGKDTGRYVFLDIDSFWMPVKPEELTLE